MAQNAPFNYYEAMRSLQDEFAQKSNEIKRHAEQLHAANMSNAGQQRTPNPITGQQGPPRPGQNAVPPHMQQLAVLGDISGKLEKIFNLLSEGKGEVIESVEAEEVESPEPKKTVKPKKNENTEA